jgi:feruloyl esterase
MSTQKRSRPARLLAAGVVLGTTMMVAPATAATLCTAPTLSALGVPNVTIIAATPDPTDPTECDVLGTVTTHGFGAPNGSALFRLQLPAAQSWNTKLVFFGVGGFAGSLLNSTNEADPGAASAAHFATAITDTGHEATPTDASWALIAPGVPDQAKLADYYFRATHEVTVASKELVRRFYATPLKRAYFDGCSNGGRQAMVEATKFPDDYDGIITGDPFMDIRTILAGVNFDKIQLGSAQVYIPATKLPMIDAAVYSNCDAADGVVDHLIQNPTACSFDPHSLVTPTCTPSDPTCLTQGQADTLQKYLTALRDDDGNIVYTGETISDLEAGAQGLFDFGLGGMDFWTTGIIPPTQGFDASEPWDNNGFSPSPTGWQFTDHLIKFIVERDPNFNMRTYLRQVGTVSDVELALFDGRTEVGDGDVPARLLPFIDRGKKMVIYHGFSDPALTATRTIRYYEELAATAHASFAQLQESVRLFMVPGMHHCVGGPGPNFFDTLTALDRWVDQGEAPEAIIATHFVADTPPVVDRTMPLCKFPEEARFSGKGDVNDAANWSCIANDQRLLRPGTDGRAAGLGATPMHGHEEE